MLKDTKFLEDYTLFYKNSFKSKEIKLFPLFLYSIKYDIDDMIFLLPNMILVKKSFMHRFKKSMKELDLYDTLSRTISFDSMIKKIEANKSIFPILENKSSDHKYDSLKYIITKDYESLDEYYYYIKSKYIDNPIIKDMSFDQLLDSIKESIENTIDELISLETYNDKTLDTLFNGYRYIQVHKEDIKDKFDILEKSYKRRIIYDVLSRIVK